MHSGLSMIRGALQARGIRVQRNRIIESMHRVDPLSIIIRRRIATYRRQYSAVHRVDPLSIIVRRRIATYRRQYSAVRWPADRKYKMAEMAEFAAGSFQLAGGFWNVCGSGRRDKYSDIL